MPLALIDSTRDGFQGGGRTEKFTEGAQSRIEAAVGSRVSEAVIVVGTVNGDVALNARPGGCRTVCGRDFRLIRRGRRQMTLQADGVDFGFGEELWITTPVRRMTGYATGLHDCLVLVDPGSGHFNVAFEAGRNLLSDSGL